MSQWFEEPGVYIAPANTPLEEMVRMMRHVANDGFVYGRGYSHMSDAQGELLYRVNARIKGDNPGEPMNWKGERGIRR